MTAANQILTVGGMLVLASGFALGIPMAMVRSRTPRAPRYLVAAHLAAIIQGGMLLALTIAVGFSNLTAGVETVAAALLVGGVALFDLGMVVNWVQGIEDAFAAKSPGHRISSAGTPLVLVATGILTYGVLVAA